MVAVEFVMVVAGQKREVVHWLAIDANQDRLDQWQLHHKPEQRNKSCCVLSSVASNEPDCD